jgi:hypothetical protein
MLDQVNEVIVFTFSTVKSLVVRLATSSVFTSAIHNIKAIETLKTAKNGFEKYSDICPPRVSGVPASWRE